MLNFVCLTLEKWFRCIMLVISETFFLFCFEKKRQNGLFLLETYLLVVGISFP